MIRRNSLPITLVVVQSLPPADVRNIFLRATFAGVTGIASIHLINQPNPYMKDGPISWLSTDVRVFQLRPTEALTGSSIQVGNPDTVIPMRHITTLWTASYSELMFSNTQA
jgi:hypothetical protein